LFILPINFDQEIYQKGERKMRILLALIAVLAIGCKGPESAEKSSGEKRAPKTFVFGDNMIRKMGINGKTHARDFDGSNGAMAYGQCQMVAWEDYQPGDKIIFAAGYFDSLWSDNPDAYDQAEELCTSVLWNAKNSGAEITIITNIKGTPSVHATVLAPGSSFATSQAGADRIASIFRDLALDLGADLIDLNAVWIPQDSYFDGVELSDEGFEEVVRLIGDQL
jgi:hypothetical protein